MEMPSSPEPAITTEGSIAAFMEMILYTALPLKPLDDPPIEMQQLIAKQTHAVVVLYNYYQRKRHPDLRFLDFESFCKLAATLQPELVPYMKNMHQSDYKSSDVPEDQLSLTEKAIKDACNTCLALDDVPEDMPIKEDWPISKIVVMLVDPTKENCLYIFGSVTRGVWSFLEQTIDNHKLSSDGAVARKKRRRINKKDLVEEQYTTEAGYEQLAVPAIMNFTGLKKTDLVLLESHVVYSVSKEKTAANFFIVKCAVKFQEKLNITYWVPMKEVVESLQGPLANWLIGSWTPTSVTQSYHLLPYSEILSNYFSRLKHSSHEGEHQRTIGDKSQSSQELRPETDNDLSFGCLNNFKVMVSTSSFNTNEANDATIISPNMEDNIETGMAGPTCSLSSLHTVDSDETDAVSICKEDKTKNNVSSGKIYQQYRKRTSTRRDVTVSTLSVKDKEAADLEVKRNVPDFKADKLDTVKNTVTGLEVDNVGTLNKSFNNNSVKTNSPEKVEPTSFANEKELYVADKEKELSVAAFRVLLSKRERLTHQLRNLGDEIAICDKNIQTKSDGGKDSFPQKTDTSIDFRTEVCVQREAFQDSTCQHAKDQVSSQQVKGKSIIEAMIPDQIFCQVLDRICHDNKWTSPTYSVSTCDGGYTASVTVKGEDFELSVNVNDTVHPSPGAAKDSAAVQMIDKLRRFVGPNK
ncbi:uncharacterized protein LOC108197047 isoform X2 [Daucus carota subsp. sativus]|uniref:DRBM domain-containing protein n=1 Tax=Daucus carota subsp. sativus TaxID=79200 RepID=A0A175YN57_DAUCS|nr:PREDICTED: uncharacterized protein LOC108197047 [Daucus carota subsp. sativus]